MQELQELSEQEMCYARVKVQSCLQAKEIKLQVWEGPQGLLSDLTIPVQGEEEDVCLSVPCSDGRVAKPLKLTVASATSDDLDIAVSPQYLDSQLVNQDGSPCFDPSTEVAAIITCSGEQQPAGQSAYKCMLMT